MFWLNYGGGCGMLIALIIITIVFMLAMAALPYILIGAVIFGLYLFLTSK